MATIDASLPPYLARRAHWTDDTVARDIALGDRMYQQSREENRMQRAFEWQQQLQRFALEEKERAVEGSAELASVFGEMGRSGSYTDPELVGKFWDTVAQRPHVASTPLFKQAVDTMQAAEQAAAMRSRVGMTYDLRGQELDQRHLLKLDEIDAQLEKALAIEGLKQEDREKLQSLRHTNNLERDRLKPTTRRPEQQDLNESDRMLMQAELRSLESWRETHTGAQHDIEYARRLKGVEDKYSGRRKTRTVGEPVGAVAAPDKRVRVQSPDGKVGSIPESQVNDALKRGFKVLQ